MKRLVYILPLIIVILISCTPDLFILNKKDPENRIYGLIMSDIDSVQALKDNQIRIFEGGRAALKVIDMTQNVCDFTVNINDGFGVRFGIRTVSNNYDVHPSISLEYTPYGTTIKENNVEIAKVDSVKALYDQPHRLIITNDGKLVNIVIDCDTVLHRQTELPATEYIIVETMLGTDAILSGIQFSGLSEAFIE